MLRFEETVRRLTEYSKLVVERLTFEIQRTRENKTHEREKLVLRLEKKSRETKKKIAALEIQKIVSIKIRRENF